MKTSINEAKDKGYDFSENLKQVLILKAIDLKKKNELEELELEDKKILNPEAKKSLEFSFCPQDTPQNNNLEKFENINQQLNPLVVKGEALEITIPKPIPKPQDKVGNPNFLTRFCKCKALSNLFG